VAVSSALTLATRSICALMVVTSVADLLLAAGSMWDSMKAVLVIVPTASSLTLALMVKVALPPGPRLTEVLILPYIWLFVAQLDPFVALHIQPISPSAFGKLSIRSIPAAVLGPLLVTIIV